MYIYFHIQSLMRRLGIQVLALNERVCCPQGCGPVPMLHWVFWSCVNCPSLEQKPAFAVVRPLRWRLGILGIIHYGVSLRIDQNFLIRSEKCGFMYEVNSIANIVSTHRHCYHVGVASRTHSITKSALLVNVSKSSETELD